MATKAQNQITILDITDGYSANLSTEAYTFAGNTAGVKSTQSFSTVVSGLCGTNAVTAAVDVSALSLPTGLTVTSDKDGNTPTLTFTATTALTDAVLNSFGRVIDLPVVLDGGEVTIHKSIAISIALTGSTGTYATNVLVGNESVSIPCDKNGSTNSAFDITIPFAGYYGSSRKACTVTVSGLPDGITSKSNTGATTSADGSLVLSVATGKTLGGKSSGEITLTFSCNSISFVKKFSWSKAVTGATGGQGPQGPQGNPGTNGTNGTSATSVVCGNEAVTIPCALNGKAKAASTIVIPFAGYIGTTRAACSVTYSTLPSGVTLASNGNKAATTSADGSLTLNVASGANFGSDTTYTGEITLTFTCNSQTFVKKFTWSKAMTGATGGTGPQGPKGNPGNDSIQLTIISSNGLIFKNTGVSTTLTAHVYKGGVEVTGTSLSSLGTIKWYKNGGSEAVATGVSLTVSPTDVANLANYEARLEA